MKGRGERTKFIIITGLSGAGKSLAAKFFEDFGFFCVDNLPTILIPKFAEICLRSKISRSALVIDIREGEFLGDLFSKLDSLVKLGIEYSILFLEARDEVLIRRFRETRRKHPLDAAGMGLEEIIHSERERLKEIRKRSFTLDTSDLTPRDLQNRLKSWFIPAEEEKLTITLISFGYKYGVPVDSDLVFDARFLPNPHYSETLRSLTGEDEGVVSYVMRNSITEEFLKKIYDLIKFLIPQYKNEGRSYLTIAFGCTGGKHRSIVLVNKVASFIKSLNQNLNVIIEHRDINRPD
jgi:UPF0042 nucleotide-binding protein